MAPGDRSLPPLVATPQPDDNLVMTLLIWRWSAELVEWVVTIMDLWLSWYDKMDDEDIGWIWGKLFAPGALRSGDDIHF